MRDILAVVLAGGAGERLYPLTKHRTKPAVPFGGIRRTIISKYVNIPPGTIIEYDHEEHRHNYTVSEKGVVAIPKETKVSPNPHTSSLRINKSAREALASGFG